MQFILKFKQEGERRASPRSKCRKVSSWRAPSSLLAHAREASVAMGGGGVRVVIFQPIFCIPSRARNLYLTSPIPLLYFLFGLPLCRIRIGKGRMGQKAKGRKWRVGIGRALVLYYTKCVSCDLSVGERVVNSGSLCHHLVGAGLLRVRVWVPSPECLDLQGTDRSM